MKIEKSNNPAAVGGLSLVLVLIVGRVAWMIFGHGVPVAAASTVSAAPPVPSAASAPVIKAAPAPEGAGASSAAVPISTRNPFSTGPAPAARHLDGSPHSDAAAMGAGDMPLTPLPAFPVRVLAGPGAGARRPPTVHVLAAPSQHERAAKELAETRTTLKLTATVGGTEPLAVVQTTTPEPVILHVGDCLDGMRVIAIHEQEVVFARGNGFWTLPLQSAADGAADSASMTTTPTAPEPVIPAAAPEEKTDERQ